MTILVAIEPAWPTCYCSIMVKIAQSSVLGCLVFVLATASVGLGDPVSRPFTAMTYNVGGFARIPIGPAQYAQIAQEVITSGADVVGFQEVDIGTRQGNALFADMAVEISAALDAAGSPMTYVVTSNIIYFGGQGNIAIFSRHPIISTGFEIIETYGSQTASVLKSRLRTVEQEPGMQVHRFGTHKQVTRDYVMQYPDPGVLVGDFNMSSNSLPYGELISVGIVDSCVSAGSLDCLTVGPSANVTPPLPRLAQIDFVFGSPGMQFSNAYIPPTTMSDHFPLVATTTIPALAELPLLFVSTAAAALSTDVCGEIAPGVLRIRNDGGGALAYTVSSDASWLSVSAPAGDVALEEDEVAIHADFKGLEQGVHTASLTIPSPQSANGPFDVEVTLNVTVDDADDDRVADACDNCPTTPNASQADSDANACDNCPAKTNADQQDTDADGRGDACDNCVGQSNPDQVDTDQDGLGDACDACPNGRLGARILSNGCPASPADFDADGDVDQADFGLIQRCLIQPGHPQTDPACALARLDPDVDVDSDDLAMFHLCYSGPNVIADADCLLD